MGLQENKCSHLAPELRDKELLPDTDALKQIYEKQIELQKFLGQLSAYRDGDMVKKCEFIKDNIIHVMAEFTELLERLPFKHWKKYTPEMKCGWISEEQRNETLFEYIDALHFFFNIGIILGFTADEIHAYYMAKHQENKDRQKKGY